MTILILLKMMMMRIMMGMGRMMIRKIYNISESGSVWNLHHIERSARRDDFLFPCKCKYVSSSQL